MMKSLMCLCLSGACLVSAAWAAAPMEPIGKLPLSKGESAFVVEGGEATINDGLIKRIAVGNKTVTASYLNSGQEAKRFEYTIRLYNRYGLLLGEDTVGNVLLILGGVGSIKPGDVATEELTVTWFPLDRVTSKSRIPLPDDWRTVKWVVLSDTNTGKSKPDAGDGK